jgi:transforming growth factor-beta-induced protein
MFHRSSPVNGAFENDELMNNNEDVITNVLQYHMLQGKQMASKLNPGTPVPIPTLLTSSEYTNMTGGQVVQNVQQAGDVVVFVSGKGSRSTLIQAVCIPARAMASGPN